MKRSYAPTALLVALLLFSACAPSLAPLYRDYDIVPLDTFRTAPLADFREFPEILSDAPSGEDAAPAMVRQRIVAALHEAGWDTTSTSLPHAVATRERVLQRWGLYRIVAYLEVAPLGRNHVRIYAHPFRKYVFGKASKIPYLTRPIRSRFLPEIDEAFSKYGLEPVGTPFERDDTVLR